VIQDVEILFASYDKGMFWFPDTKFCNIEWLSLNNCMKQRYPHETAKIAPIIHHISEILQDRT